MNPRRKMEQQLDRAEREAETARCECGAQVRKGHDGWVHVGPCTAEDEEPAWARRSPAWRTASMDPRNATSLARKMEARARYEEQVAALRAEEDLLHELAETVERKLKALRSKRKTLDAQPPHDPREAMRMIEEATTDPNPGP